jgi:RimJ/RimL family protein N-acetyltransferase
VLIMRNVPFADANARAGSGEGRPSPTYSSEGTLRSEPRDSTTTIAAMDRAALAARYPQFGLRVAHRDLALVPPGDGELRALAAVVGTPGGIVTADEAHYVTWPTGTPDAAAAFLDFHRRLRVAPTPERWLVPFAVLDGGRAVGVVVLESAAWPAQRTVGTRAWLARSHQGRGLGRRARLMLLEVAFAHLEARAAVTTAAEDNHASRRITERLGYRETGRGRGDDGVEEIHYRLARDAHRERLDGTEVDGVTPFRAAIEPYGSPPA